MFLPPIMRHSILKNTRLACRQLCTSGRCLQSIYYTGKHEWVRVEDDRKSGTVGISTYAEQKLGDIVFVELPNIGDHMLANEQCGIVESVKAVSDVYSPVTGHVTEVNTDLESQPALVNKSPLEKGWLFKLQLSTPSELDKLMTEEKYKVYLEEESS